MRNRKKLLQLNRTIYKIPITIIINNNDRLNAFPLTLGKRQGCLFLPLMVKIVLQLQCSTDASSQCIKARKRP